MIQAHIGLTLFAYFKNDLGSNPSRDSADLGTSGPTMAPHFMEGLSLFGNEEAVDSSVPDLMNLPAKGMTDLLLEERVGPRRGQHGFLVLLNFLKPLSARDAPDRHNGAGQRTA